MSTRRHGHSDHSVRHLQGHLKAWTTGTDSKKRAPGVGAVRCYLGGSDILNTPQVFTPADARGAWLPWSGAVDPRVTAVAGAQAPYLWPINRALNPNFKGVIYVAGKVAVSGKLRGRMTLAASGNIIIADDITYVTDPGARQLRRHARHVQRQRRRRGGQPAQRSHPVGLQEAGHAHWDES